MEIKKASFVASYPRAEDAPKSLLPEFAFIGRSNVGKSSLINLLVQQKGLAKVSQTPGKTQLLNFFLINEAWHLVDLPGYGYAKVSKTMRAGFSKLIEKYFEGREQLACAFVLIDPNIPPQKIDLEFLAFLARVEAPVALVFTKTDKTNQREVSDNIKKFLAEMKKTWKVVPPFFMTSAEKKRGREEVLAYIADALKN